jgi:tetratricopeptide (TPR) repeat protein
MDKDKFKWLFHEFNRAVRLAQDGNNQEAELILRPMLPDIEEIYRLTGEPEMLMTYLATLASVTSQLQDFDIAIEDTQRIIEFAKSIGDNQRVKKFTRNLTKQYLFKGAKAVRNKDLDSAIEIFLEAKELAIKVGDYRDEGRCLGNIATIYRMKGDPKLAIELHERAMQLFESHGCTDSYAMECCNMGNAYLDLKQFHRAYSLYNRILAEHNEKMTDYTRYLCIRGLAMSAHQLEDWSVATEYYTKALDIAQMIQYLDEIELLKAGLQKVAQKERLE